MEQYIERLVDLTDSKLNRLVGLSLENARELLWSSDPNAVRGIDGSFALVDKMGKNVRLARSMDRPLRYFLAKRQEGPALIVADRIDKLHAWLTSENLAEQFHPSYTRMVPAHYVVEIQLIGCPDPDPTYTRFFIPKRNSLPNDLDEIGKAYIGALTEEISKWLQSIPEQEPIGVAFSGGIDSGAVFLTTYHALIKLGMNPARLKAFTLTFDEGPDLDQAREFLGQLGLDLFLEPVKAGLQDLDVAETIRIVEDYKSLDIEAASMGVTLCRKIRRRYPEWKYLLDGDGGDENLKDYPIEENPELTIRSVINNLMLYQEGWGVGKIKHSLTYSGGLSRSYARTYAPARHFNFDSFSPFTRPQVMEIAEGIPFADLTDYQVSRLYGLKGEIVQRGVAHHTGQTMPIFPKRRFQHGALTVDRLRERLPEAESELRQQFLAQYS